jgi:hypothetical protein
LTSAGEANAMLLYNAIADPQMLFETVADGSKVIGFVELNPENKTCLRICTQFSIDNELHTELLEAIIRVAQVALKEKNEELKPGDRVEITYEVPGREDFKKGDRGVLLENDYKSHYDYFVKIDRTEQHVYFHKGELKKANDGK